MKISHVESRPSKTQAEKENGWDILVDCGDCSEDKIDTLVSKLIGEHCIMTVRKKESEIEYTNHNYWNTHYAVLAAHGFWLIIFCD